VDRPPGAQLVDDLRDQRHVRAREQRQADRVGVFLQRRFRDLAGRLEQAGVDDLEAGVAQGPSDHLGAPIVSVQAGLGDHDAVASQHSAPPFVARRDEPITVDRGPVTIAKGA